MQSKKPEIFCASITFSTSSLELLVAMPSLILRFLQQVRNSLAPGFKKTSWVYLSQAIRFHSAFISSTQSGIPNLFLK